MKKKGMAIILAIMTIFSITLIGEENRTHVLIIACGEFDNKIVNALPSVIKDAEEFKEQILEIKATEEENIKEYKNPTQSQINIAFLEMGKQLKENDRIIIYYGGHGFSGKEDGNLYIVPKDFQEDYKEETSYNLTAGLERMLNRVRLKEGIVIIDACYSGGILKGRPIEGMKIEESNLIKIAKENGIGFLLSSSEEEISREREEGGGIFSHWLTEGMKGEAKTDRENATLTLEELYEYTKDKVTKESQGLQNPKLISNGNIEIGEIPQIKEQIEENKRKEEEKSRTEKIRIKLSSLIGYRKISLEEFSTLMKIIEQTEKMDTNEETKIRKYLYTLLYKDLEEEFLELFRDTTTPVNEAPNEPVRISPKGENERTEVELEWECTDPEWDEIQYDIYFGKEATPKLYKSGIKETKIKIENLENDTNYYWMIVANDSKNKNSTKGPVWVFKTMERIKEGEITISSIPSGASVYIDNKHTGQTPITQTLTAGKYGIKIQKEGYEEYTTQIEIRSGIKHSTTLQLEQKKYEIRIESEPTGAQLYIDNEYKGITPIVLELTSEKHTIKLQADGYKEHIKTIDVNRVETIKAMMEKENRAPNKPKQSSPDNEEEIEGKNVTLRWNGSDPDGDMLTYGIYIGTSQNNMQMVTNTNTTAYTHSNLNEGQTYYWKIVASDIDYTVESETRSFRTKKAVKEYTITISSENSAMGKIRIHNGNWTNSQSITVKEGEEITIEAKAESGYKFTGWYEGNNKISINTEYCFNLSENRYIEARFEKENLPPNIPDLITPINYAKNQSTSLTLKWSGNDPDGDKLIFDVYLGTSITELIHKTSTTNNSWTISDLNENSTYYWKIVAKDNLGKETESNIHIFETKIEFVRTAPVKDDKTVQHIKPIFIRVKAGTFKMGSNTIENKERPIHNVSLTYDYWIGKYEVTFDEFDAFTKAIGVNKVNDNNWGRGNMPIININWWDAIDYCNWLSKREFLKPAYDDYGNLIDINGIITTDISKVEGYRLPTEAEWEYAAKGAQRSTNNFKYAGSNSIEDISWYKNNSEKKTHPVGEKKPNELGLYDMSGNASEWCYDWYGIYTRSDKVNPIGPYNGSNRVNRGGSWFGDAKDSLVEYRNSNSSSYSLNMRGFRIAKTIF